MYFAYGQRPIFAFDTAHYIKCRFSCGIAYKVVASMFNRLSSLHTSTDIFANSADQDETARNCQSVMDFLLNPYL